MNQHSFIKNMTLIILPAEIQSKILLLREPSTFVNMFKELIMSVKLYNVFNIHVFKPAYSLRKTPFDKRKMYQIKDIHEDIIVNSHLLPSHINRLKKQVEDLYLFLHERWRNDVLWNIRNYNNSKLRKVN